MPLSDHEQRLLEQMEQALYQEDPKFASSLQSARNGGIDRRKIAVGVGGVVLGLATVVAGVAVTQPIVGVVGFVIMIAGGFWAWMGSHGTPNAENGAAAPSAPPPAAMPRDPRSQTDFMSKMEERWRNRREGGDSPF